jgi:hypothetical protein
MVDNTENYWAFGLCPSSDILETREHNVLETGSLSVLRRGGKTPTLLGPLERAISKGRNRVGVFPPRLRTETDPVSETLCFLVFRISDDERSPKTQ